MLFPFMPLSPCRMLALAVVSVLAFSLLALASSIVIVREAEAIVIERLGKYSRTLQSGLHFLTPFVEGCKRVYWSVDVQRGDSGMVMGYRIPLHNVVVDLPPFKVMTKDRIECSVDPSVQYRIIDPAKAVYAGQNLHAMLQQLVLALVREAAASMTLEELTTARTEVFNKFASKVLEERRAEWGVTIRLDLQHLESSKQIMRATEKAVAAQREAEAELIRERAQFLGRVAQMENEQKLTEMRLEAERKQRIAQMETQLKEVELKAKADATYFKILKEVLSESSVLRLEALKAWQTLASKAKPGTVILPLPADVLPFSSTSPATAAPAAALLSPFLQQQQQPGHAGVRVGAVVDEDLDSEEAVVLEKPASGGSCE